MRTARREPHPPQPRSRRNDRRLKAYERAGPDVLYAPGLATLDEIRAVRNETTWPLNVLARSRLSMSELADAGAPRVSLGSRLALVALLAAAAAAEEIRNKGDFSSLAVRVPLNEWLGG